MFKHIIFSVILNVFIIASAVIGYYGYKANNYFIVLVCLAAMGLTIFYKIRHNKLVREEMKQKAELKVKSKSKIKK